MISKTDYRNDSLHNSLHDSLMLLLLQADLEDEVTPYTLDCLTESVSEHTVHNGSASWVWLKRANMTEGVLPTHNDIPSVEQKHREGMSVGRYPAAEL